MKKRVALLLAAVMLLSMVGCSGSADPAETASAATEPAATHAVTEALESVDTEVLEASAPEFPVFEPMNKPAVIPTTVSVEDLLLSGDTKTIVGASYKDCVRLLMNLGFIELLDTAFSADMCGPCNLSYNSKAFKMEFEFNMFSDRFNLCAIYGAKGECLSNISGPAFTEYDNIYEFPIWVSMDKVSHLDVVPQYIGYDLANFGSAEDAWSLQQWGLDKLDWGIYDLSAMISDIARYTAIYSPGTGNVYNIFSSYIEPGDYLFMDYHTSVFLRQPNEIVRRVWENAGVEKVLLRHPDDISFESEGMEDCFYFERGMTFSEWCNSKYNLDGWKFFDNGGYGEIRSQDDQYYLLISYTLDSNGTARESKMDMLLEDGCQTAVSVYRVQ